MSQFPRSQQDVVCILCQDTTTTTVHRPDSSVTIGPYFVYILYQPYFDLSTHDPLCFSFLNRIGFFPLILSRSAKALHNTCDTGSTRLSVLDPSEYEKHTLFNAWSNRFFPLNSCSVWHAQLPPRAHCRGVRIYFTKGEVSCSDLCLIDFSVRTAL